MPSNDTERRRKLKRDLAAVGLLALMVVAAFGNVIFGGKSLVPSENMNPLHYRASERNYEPGFVPHEEWTRRDLVTYPNYRDAGASVWQMEPAQELLHRSLQRGEFPFWDPYVGGGTPSFSSLIPAYLFPPSLVVVLLGNGSLVKNIYILLLILTSGTLTYFLLRRHGLSWQASVAGAVAFAFSGAVIQTAPSGLGQPTAFFSLPLLVTARLLDRPDARRAAELALAFAFVALASFPPILMQVFGTCVVYLIVGLILRRRGERVPSAGWFAAGAIVGMAVAGIAYIPALPVMAAATHISEFYSSAAIGTLEPKLILQLLSPTIAGGVPIYLNAPLLGTTHGHLYYTGVIALFLSGIGFVARAEGGARVLKITAIVVGGLALAKILGVPPVQWVIHVPLLRNIHYLSYFGIVVAYAIAILAALGVDALVKGRARRWQVAASGAVLAAALVIMRVSAARAGVSLHHEGWRWIADFRVLVLFALLGIAFTLLAAASARSTRVAMMLVIAVLATEGISNSVYPRQQRRNIWSHPPRYIEILTERNSGGRVLPMPRYPANTGQVFGHATLDSVTLYTSVRMFEFYQHYFSTNDRVFLRGTRRIPPERVLDVANIEYFAISPADKGNLMETTNRGYERLFADDFVHMVRRPTTPRYWLASDYRVATTKQAALEALATLPVGTVILEEQPSFAPSPGSPADGHLRVARFSLNEVELAVDSPRTVVLVCSESNMSGWTATVDGRPARILWANFAFRGVEVPAGSHTISFRYRAPGLYVGLLATVAGLIACFLGLRRRPRALPARAS